MGTSRPDQSRARMRGVYLKFLSLRAESYCIAGVLAALVTPLSCWVSLVTYEQIWRPLFHLDDRPIISPWRVGLLFACAWAVFGFLVQFYRQDPFYGLIVRRALGLAPVEGPISHEAADGAGPEDGSGRS